MIFDEESEEDFLGEDSDIGGEDLQSMGGIEISPLAENVDVLDDKSRPLPKKKTRSLDLKPIVITYFALATAAFTIFSEDESTSVSEPTEVPDLFVPEVEKGTLDKPEVAPEKTEHKVVKKSKTSKPRQLKRG